MILSSLAITFYSNINNFFKAQEVNTFSICQLAFFFHFVNLFLSSTSASV